MKKLKLAIATGMLATAPAFADYNDYGNAGRGNVSYDFATVIEAKPIMRLVKVSTPREECWQETVVYDDYDHGYDRDRNKGNGLGTVLGGVVGGAIGNAVGHEKRNKQVGAVVGAVVGATLGSAIAQSARAERYDNRPTGRYARYGKEEVCEVIHDYHEEERIIGYNVRYRYNDETYSTRMDTDPGDTIKVRLAVSPVAG